MALLILGMKRVLYARNFVSIHTAFQQHHINGGGADVFICRYSITARNPEKEGRKKLWEESYYRMQSADWNRP